VRLLHLASKRALDILLGLPLFVLSLPILGLLALCIKCVNRGPAFYTQERIGLGNRPIRIWKLRTMYVDSEQRLKAHLAASAKADEEWRRHFKLRRDPRILPFIGSFLRRSSLDELPQLWNVLCGQMSLVGPRPLPQYHVSHFRRDLRVLRHSVLPGLTGLWQVSARSDADLDVQQMLDAHYIRSWSIWLDLYLLVRTVDAVVSGRGAY